MLVDNACTDSAVGKEVEGICLLLRAKIKRHGRSLSDCSLTPAGVFWLETGLLLRRLQTTSELRVCESRVRVFFVFVLGRVWLGQR